jgi:hypothetical protein
MENATFSWTTHSGGRFPNKVATACVEIMDRDSGSKLISSKIYQQVSVLSRGFWSLAVSRLQSIKTWLAVLV